jgi:hypothetical protein
MNSRNTIIFHIVLVAVLVYFLAISLQMQLQRVIFPVVVLGIAILASLLKLAALVRPQWQPLLDPEGMFEGMGKGAVADVAATTDVDEDTGLAAQDKPQQKLTLLNMVVWIAVTMAGIILFGFPLGSALSTVVYMGVLSKEKWVPTLITAAAVAISLYLVFTVALEVEPYQALLFGF